MKTLRTLAWITAAFAYAIIVLGFVVRITGSGMGCGDDWPLCNGRVLPAFDSAKTVIEFAVPGAGIVALRVYNASGRLVRTLVQREYDGPTRDRAVWDGRDAEGRSVSSGIYFYRLEMGERVATRKMMLLK